MIKDQMPKILGATRKEKVELYVTKCVMKELEHIGIIVGGALFIAKTLTCFECGHESGSGASCISKLVGNKNTSKYIVASQDEALKAAVRAVPGCPLILLHGGLIPILEAPSQVSLEMSKAAELKKLTVKDWERSKLPELRRQDAKALRKKRKIKGPNPLSCKKKKVKIPVKKVQEATTEAKPKRVRKRPVKKGNEKSE